MRARIPALLVHAANSAAALRRPDARFDMVRCGIAIYGMDPFHRDPADHGLEPALELVSYVAEVKRCEPGQSAGYGRRFVAERADLARHDPDRLRRRRTAAGSPTTPTCSSTAAACRSWAPSRWTTSPSTSATTPADARRARRS